MDSDAPAMTRLETGLDGALGFQVGEVGEDRVTGSFEVSDSVRQPFGIVHGGSYAAMAEMLASVGTYMAVQSRDEIAVGQSNHTHFIRPVTEGTVHAEGRSRHRGRTSWIWDVDFTDDGDRLCATSRVIIAVRPGRPAPPAS